MSDMTATGLPDAARQLGVPLRVLRRAIRAGRLPALPANAATAPLPAGWLESAKTAAEAAPKTFSRADMQRVPPFARYKGTSAWRKYRARVREYNSFQAASA